MSRRQPRGEESDTGSSPDSRHPPAAPRLGLWIGLITTALTVLLIHAGFTTGDWRGVLISELQILVVATVSYLGLRAGR